MLFTRWIPALRPRPVGTFGLIDPLQMHLTRLLANRPNHALKETRPSPGTIGASGIACSRVPRAVTSVTWIPPASPRIALSLDCGRSIARAAGTIQRLAPCRTGSSNVSAPLTAFPAQSLPVVLALDSSKNSGGCAFLFISIEQPHLHAFL
jgi:hypothetical protein